MCPRSEYISILSFVSFPDLVDSFLLQPQNNRVFLLVFCSLIRIFAIKMAKLLTLGQCMTINKIGL